jgi:uncharacterized protein (DUF885 family)
VEITILRVPHANVKTFQGVFLEAAECGSYPFNHGYRGRSFMLDRRSVLLSSAAAGAVALIGVPPLAAAETDAAKLNGLFDSFVDARLDRSPEEVTQLGLDKDARAAQKSLLDDRSLAGIASDRKRNADELAQLNAIDRNALTGTDAINYDVVHYGLATAVASASRHDYGGANAGIPYVVSNFGGAYQSIPDFLDSQHAIEIKADADAYIARLSAFATALDQEDEVIRHDAGVGAVSPDFVLSRTLSLIENLRRPKPELSTLVSSVARRAKEKDIAGDYAGDAMRIVAEKIYPALDRQMETLKSLQPKAVHDAGVWRLPNGEQYYKDSLTAWATTDRAPDDIHQTGLDLVADFTARIDALMKANDLTKGTVGERLRTMYDDPKFRYPNTDTGKEKLIADLNVKMAEVKKRLPQYFGVLPKADVVIKRVPKAIEEGQAGGYYQNPSLDGSRPGIYYINLRNTAEVPSWTLPTVTYHEAIPGHHLQGTIQLETNLPMIRKLSFFSAYIEGWALYAEQLADEMGLYENDPFGRIGYLHDAMFRAVRLVVDTGLHAKRWSREQAIKYYVDTLGDQEASAVTEVERYCVWPGQACSYMLGKLDFLRLRAKSKAELGSRFDIRDYHDAVLLCGAVPLATLDPVVDAYIKAKT